MSYAPHTEAEIGTMLERIGVRELRELFDTVPARLRSRAELKLPAALSEQQLLAHLGSRAALNLGDSHGTSFLGAGAYSHYAPAAVDALASRGEFATAYTPYQAEISQGTLQAIYEFQTLIAQLTGLDVANASLYDGASAAAEAALMALRTQRRRRVALSAALHPHYAAVIRTYLDGLDVDVDVVPVGADGRTAPDAVPNDCACLLVQTPNFYGCVEDLEAAADRAHEAGALLVSVTTEPLALALLRSPGDAGADIACGEAQSFGVPPSFGGPFVGFMSTRKKHVRQLPGRLIGETVDSDGERAFVMTLTTREQHIRREKATSNICTNQGLCALRVVIYLSLMGRRGLRQLAENNLALAQYARSELARAGLTLPFAAPVFNEFVVEVPGLAAREEKLLGEGLAPGFALGRVDPEQRDRLLVCVTEQHGRAQIDRLVRGLAA